MADIFQDEFISAEQGDVENPFSSDDVAEEEKKEDKSDEEEKTKDNDQSFLNKLLSCGSECKSVDVVVPQIPTLEELADSDFIHNRQLAAKSIVEYLHQAGTNKEALHSVISVMCKLLEDEDLVVRSELMEHIPSIALFCKQRSEDLGVVIRQQIVPYTVKLVADAQIQIRKIGHTTLLVLLENKIVDDSHLTEWICPLIAQLATSESNPEDVSVMCKMFPYVGKEITEKFFLEPFLSLLCDRSSSSREVCMLHFGNLAKVLGRETTESILLPVFLDLCQEEMPVGINIVQCIDIAVELANVVSPTTRSEVLTRVYIDFLNAKSRAVYFSAYLSLGRFISTFADPSKTGLYYKDGLWIDIPFEDDDIEDPQNNVNYYEHITSRITPSASFLDELCISKLHVLLHHQNNSSYNSLYNSCINILQSNPETALNEKLNDENLNFTSTLTDTRLKSNKINGSKLAWLRRRNIKLPLTVDTKDELHLHVDNENLFNNFQFWRTPLPEVELDIDVEECKSANINLKAKMHSEEDVSETSELNVKISPNETSKDSVNTPLKTDINIKIIEFDEKPSIMQNKFHSECLAPCGLHFVKNKNENTKENFWKTIYDQNIVPPELLREYVDSTRVSSETDDVRLNYAYYFPSVAYTLGRKYWSSVRGTFHWLASNRLYSVKKSMASSLHELAIILGRDITNKDLFPVFREYLLDEKLRAIVLKDISHFLKNLRPSDRKPFLHLLKGLCVWEEERDWRYRLSVAEQLIPCIELFTPCEALHFFSVSLTLLQDKICAVRKAAVQLLAASLGFIVRDPKSSLFLKAALIALNERYRKSNKWLWRQMYVYICQELAIRKSLPTELYIEEVIPNLFALTWDTVPNVRLALARCIGLTLLPLDFLPTIQKTHDQLLLEVMFSLLSDSDYDVRYFAHLSSSAF